MSKECPYCKAEVKEDEALCPNCGQTLTPAQEQKTAPQPGGWGGQPVDTPAGTGGGWSGGSQAYSQTEKNVGGYHRGYANTLKVITYLFTIGVPLIVFLMFAMGMRYASSTLLAAAFLGCCVLAFVLWVTFSYVTKLFDLISKNAMLSDLILQELRKQGRGK